MKHFILLITFFSLLTISSCNKNIIVNGILNIGFESNVFIDESGTKYWIKNLPDSLNESYHNALISISGYVRENGKFGHLGKYENQVTINSLKILKRHMVSLKNARELIRNKIGPEYKIRISTLSRTTKDPLMKFCMNKIKGKYKDYYSFYYQTKKLSLGGVGYYLVSKWNPEKIIQCGGK